MNGWQALLLAGVFEITWAIVSRPKAGARGLTADDVGRSGWDDRADCRVCRAVLVAP